TWQRFIPACAGADELPLPLVEPFHGSSPHARGGLRWMTTWGGEHRFIPACAGRTVSGGLNVSRVRVHPRTRGADPRRPDAGDAVQGSSPHARGGRGGRCLGNELLGFIPARAGRTEGRRVAARVEAVHPRTRGADHANKPRVGPSPGSSPHADRKSVVQGNTLRA